VTKATKKIVKKPVTDCYEMSAKEAMLKSVTIIRFLKKRIHKY